MVNISYANHFVGSPVAKISVYTILLIHFKQITPDGRKYARKLTGKAEYFKSLYQNLHMLGSEYSSVADTGLAHVEAKVQVPALNALPPQK